MEELFTNASINPIIQLGDSPETPTFYIHLPKITEQRFHTLSLNSWLNNVLPHNSLSYLHLNHLFSPAEISLLKILSLLQWPQYYKLQLMSTTNTPTTNPHYTPHLNPTPHPTHYSSLLHISHPSTYGMKTHTSNY